MNERLEQAVEKVIYWTRAYRDSLRKFNETHDEKYRFKIFENHTHVISSGEWLRIVYQEETGKDITPIGNLPKFDDRNEEPLI